MSSLSDSSVICAYLDEAYPGDPLLPADPADRARARWLEEYADTRLGDLFIWGLFYQKIVHPLVWGEPGDQARIEKTLDRGCAGALDYLEGQLPATGFLFGEIGLADISVASFFRNADYAGFAVDAGRWPRVAGFVDRALAHHAFASTLPVRGHWAQRRHPGPAQGPARRRRPVHGRNARHPTPRKGMMTL